MTFFLLFIFIRYSAFYYFIWYITISFTTLFPTSTRYFIQHFTTSFTPFTRHAIQYFPQRFTQHLTISFIIVLFQPTFYDFIHGFHRPSASYSMLFTFIYIHLSSCLFPLPGARAWPSHFTNHTFLAVIHSARDSRHEQVASQTIHFSITAGVLFETYIGPDQYQLYLDI